MKVLFTIAISSLLAVSAMADANWPSWRGPNADGVVPEGNPPIEWSETKNVKWKVPIPGETDATPVIWGDKIFIQTSMPTKEEPPGAAKPAPGAMGGTLPTVPWAFKLLCLDRETGKLLWEKTAAEAVPHQGHHPHTSYSAYSPVTDGEHIWVSFGSHGLYCYDLDGNEVWKRGMPSMEIMNNFGEASSPALAGDTIVVVADHEGESKIFAFNKLTGDVIWQQARDEGSTWATPLVVEHNGKHQVVTNGTRAARGYDLETGDLLWHATGMTSAAIPMPVAGHGMAFVATGFEGYALLAIRLGGTGDLNNSDSIAWRLDCGTPYVNSPLLYGDNLYMIESVKASLSAYRAETGELLFDRERIPGLKQIYSSPIGVAGRIYLCDRYGKTVVLKHGDTFEVLATNELDEGFDASPVVIGDTLYLKGEHHLYCIETGQ